MENVFYIDKAKKTQYFNTDAPVVAVKLNEKGFFPIYTSATAEDLNKRPASAEVVEAAVSASMFGWHVPAAKPLLDWWDSADGRLTVTLRMPKEVASVLRELTQEQTDTAFEEALKERELKPPFKTPVRVEASAAGLYLVDADGARIVSVEGTSKEESDWIVHCINTIGGQPEEKTFEQHFEGQFMQPVIEQGEYFEVETDNGTEFIPADLAGPLEGLSKVGEALRKEDEVKEYGDAESMTPRWVALRRALKDYVECDVDFIRSVEFKTGYLARMSAAGYMDCTDWTAHDTEEEARDYLIEQYGND